MPWSDVVTVAGVAQVATEAYFLPDGAWWLRAAASNTGVIAVVAQAGEGGTCQVRDSLGQRWNSGQVAAGINCVGIQALADGAWRVVWMQAPNGGTYAHLTLDAALMPASAAVSESSPHGPTSQGFLDLTPDGVPIMTDQNRSVVCGNHVIGLPTVRGPWTLGQDWSEGADRIIAWDAETEELFVVSDVSTPTPSHLTLQEDGSAVACPGLTDQLVHESAFVPWTPAIPPINPEPPIPPEPPEPKPPIPPDISTTLELVAMSALTLSRKNFTEGSDFPDRRLYPLGTGKNLSIDSATGEARPGGTSHTGPSESFTVLKDRAIVNFHPVYYSFLLTE